ncbi:helix-turn-helix transcriptional regulator [Romboutsia sp. 1001216sp1]|uniref:helix-turn-helix domain-containing protein n=1 Tax=unclassified Romboutsia TaxID=2626894 RepID=UPI00189CC77D|nr:MULTISPECIES: helix-turn-helix transcriptional regulator [unclassified Romboutsia]MDB8791256.1 helix-turn-helix transcriptional regulator [Romboutsia sp. 1001216sp1]MDB8801402.1 helix-turn-helix transcriptional regulator [Romboutsia sp. 1001216sp1]MDB8812800.1 helix-turn-helix transcriptional regulator [Romboutsia sp. 1001216sp1]
MEKIKIGENIKLLRRKKNITQEQLASIIGVSIPAVSKWEKGVSFPDITYLPVLANYFEVSIDDLLNYRKELDENDIAKIIKECEELISINSIEESIKLCESYMKNYPSNYKLKFKLTHIYSLAMIKETDLNKEDITNRIIEILEDIVDNTNDIELKEYSLMQLSSNYMIVDKNDKAEEVLKKIYKPNCNPDVMLPLIYMQQDKINEARKLMQQNLNTSIGEAITSCMGLAISYYSYKDDMDENSIDYSKASMYYQLAIDIDKLVYDGNQMGSFLNSNLAYINLKKGDIKASLMYLNRLVDSLEYLGTDIPRQLNQIAYFDNLDDIKKEESVNVDVLQILIDSLNTTFINLKGNKEFEDIISRIVNLRKLVNKDNK